MGLLNIHQTSPAVFSSAHIPVSASSMEMSLFFPILVTKGAVGLSVHELNSTFILFYLLLPSNPFISLISTLALLRNT